MFLLFLYFQSDLSNLQLTHLSHSPVRRNMAQNVNPQPRNMSRTEATGKEGASSSTGATNHQVELGGNCDAVMVQYFYILCLVSR